MCMYACICSVCFSTYCDQLFPFQLFWAIGAMLEAVLALVIMTNVDNDTNWRWLLGVSAIPVGLLSFVFPVRKMSYVYNMLVSG